MSRDPYTGKTTAELPLFRTPARNTDPETSRAAAQELVQSGKLSEQARQTYNALVLYRREHWQSPTSMELAGGESELRYRYARRLADLELSGFVMKDGARRCTITGKKAQTWREV